MFALVLSRYGGPEHTALTDVPQPSPRANELLVRIHAAGLNPVDFKTRIGKATLSTHFCSKRTARLGRGSRIASGWPTNRSQSPRPI
jgi:NADPH:quinone reductase-like Zn-dependent oxidoreductase